MMWMLFAMDGNKQKGKWVLVECKALKWAKANSGRWDDCDITFMITMIIK
jgi:hypothetical protein